MVPLEGESSNTIFEVLEEWEKHLKEIDLDVHMPKSSPVRTRGPRGPSL